MVVYMLLRSRFDLLARCAAAAVIGLRSRRVHVVAPDAAGGPYIDADVLHREPVANCGSGTLVCR